ncbi:MAG TPA: protein kinase, partial [Candidatus Sulfopaludibacter sp.]|nr:protein kinase [Candidatus Sulfopaludibacter sp.]
GGDPTITELAPMTPTYASPEQVRGDPITTASDVYSLGIVLYELLAGSKPYGSGASTRAELERAVCQTEPRLPSAASRADGRAQLARRLSGDLDAIVMMAIRKEPDRRYRSAAELREDLERHLDGRPVHARRSTFWYRTGRSIRRHRWTVLAAAAVTLALAAELLATLVQARIAQAQRALAERRFAEIRKIANSFLFEFDGAISDLAGATAARQLVVRKALEYLSALDKESRGDPRLQAELATAWERVGDIQGNPYLANLGDRAGALRSYREALRIWTPLAARANGAADSHIVWLHLSMGDVLSEEHRGAEALGEYQWALGAVERRSQGRSDDRIVLMARIGTELAKMGRPDEGAQWCQRAVGEARARFGGGMDEATMHNVSAVYGRAAEALLRAGAIEAAIATHREEIDLCEKLVRSAAPEKNAHYRRDLALGYQGLGDALSRERQERSALEWYKRARRIQEALLRVDPANSQMRMDLSLTLSKISESSVRAGDLSGAEEARARDLQLSERLLQDDPASALYRRLFAYSLFQMGELLRKRARIAEARHYYLRDAEILKPIENDPNRTTQRRLLDCYRALGEIETDARIAAEYRNRAAALARRLEDGREK